jgi:RNA polymerase subunit RPABC4/transcription elongation factor Spt4
MTSQDLIRLRRKEMVGVLAILCWAAFLAIGAVSPGSGSREGAAILGWCLTAAWVAIDAEVRRARYLAWTIFTLITGPVGFLLYVLTRAPAPAMCLQCGTTFANAYRPCPTCGRYPIVGRIAASLRKGYSGLVDSLARAPAEKARTTAKHMAMGLAAAFLLSRVAIGLVWPLGPLGTLFSLIAIVSLAGYWVMVAWWVYRDATWRRMDAVPWAMLALVTNVVGLVTYLVIRYPDPKSCPHCGVALPTGLKRCPYCGAEAELACPRCQSPVQPDWVFCPVCAARLPGATAPATPTAAQVSITGTVTDALTASPVEEAEIRIDSKQGGQSTAADPRGRFVLSGLEPRPYVLIASAPGYVSEPKACTPNPSGAVQLHFSLHPSRTDSTSD